MPKVFEPYHPSEISEKNKVIDGNAFSQDIKVVDGRIFESKENAISDDAEIPSTASYKVYAALVSQSGTSDPIVVVLENNLGFTPVWTRDSDIAGQYYCSAGSSTWVANKTAILIGGSNGMWDALSNRSGQRIDNTILQFNTVNNLGELGDNVFYQTLVEIRVYN